MSTLVIKARVSLIPEEQIESQLLDEGGEVTPYLVWRKTSLRSFEIKNITQYDKEKSIICTYEGEKILVKEPFSSLHKRWDEAVAKEEQREDDLMLGGSEHMNEQDSDEDEDENDI